MRNVSLLQCYYTYSRQALLGEGGGSGGGAGDISVNIDGTPKKRKKRKKKKRKDKNGKVVGSFASQTSSQHGGSLLVDASLLDDEDEDDNYNDNDEFDGF